MQARPRCVSTAFRWSKFEDFVKSRMSRPLLLIVLAVCLERSRVCNASGIRQNSNCQSHIDESSCKTESGCEWCWTRPPTEGESQTAVTKCIEWQNCVGPPNACSVRRNQSLCNATALTRPESGAKDGHLERHTGFKMDAPDPAPTCKWCRVEQRCLDESSE
jgi:hypothetical protein